MSAFMILMAVTFCLFGFIIGIWAQIFEQLQVIPLLVVYPLTFLGGAFYSLDMLPAAWRTVTLFNPVVYLISGFRWTFFGKGDVGIEVSMGAVAFFLALCLGGQSYHSRQQIRERSLAAFGQVNWAFATSWEVTGGLRLSHNPLCRSEE